MANFKKLTDWLNNPQRLVMTFKEIEHIIEDHLPDSALKYHAWWGNESDSRQSHAWLDGGWEVESVDLKLEEVVFRRKPSPAHENLAG